MIGSMIFTMVSKKKQADLNVYTKSDQVTQKKDLSKEEPLDIDMSIYTDEETGFSLEVPSDWQEVTKNGYPTFVHPASASSIQIQVLDYDPSINNETAESVSAKIAEDGMTFTDFMRKDPCSSELLYQDYQNTTYDYMVESYWDREHIVKLVCTFNDQNYEKIQPYYQKILESFAWDKQNPIPDGYELYYNEYADFEVGIPETWDVANAENAVVASDVNTGASLTITMQENTAFLDTLTATDVAQMLNSEKNNFMMKSYKNDKEQALAVSTYTIDGTAYENRYYLFATGKKIYALSFDYPSGSISEDLAGTCAGLFRDFEK